MERKDNRLSALQGATDPLVWLKRELLQEREGLEFSHEVIKDLEALAERLKRHIAPTSAPTDDSALEAFVEMLPSESLTDDFLENVNQSRKARGSDQSPALALRDLRVTAGVTVPTAAEALAITETDLEAVESDLAPWHALPAERLAGYAALLGKPVASLLNRLKEAAKRHLVSQVESRMRLSLGRYDKTQNVSRARLDALRTALAMVRDENRAALSFFRRAEQQIARKEKS